MIRVVYSSPRIENVDRVDAMLREAGVDTRIVNRDKLHRGRFQRFSFKDPGSSREWPGVQVVSAADMPKARELLRAAGLMGTTRPEAEGNAAAPRWEAPGNAHDPTAARMRRAAMFAVLCALIFLAYAYSTGKRRIEQATPAPAVSAPAAAAPVEDNTVLLLDDSAPGDDSNPEE